MEKVATIKKEQWEDSYARGENYIFETKEQVVKFLNRFVRKKIGPNEFKDIIDFSQKVKGLDFGCGIGKQSILLQEYGIEAYGTDLSENAIEFAKNLAVKNNMPDLQERLTVSRSNTLPFKNKELGVVVCDSVLDSMPFDLAVSFVKEFDRVTDGIGYISLISGDCTAYSREFDQEVIVDGKHENGTIQSYFNWTKVNKLFEGTGFKIIWAALIEESNLLQQGKKGRYHLVISNKK